jgi:hypothetical protein
MKVCRPWGIVNVSHRARPRTIQAVKNRRRMMWAPCCVGWHVVSVDGEIHGPFGIPTDDAVRAAVMAGAAAPGGATPWMPAAVRYSYTGRDLKGCKLFREAAEAICRRHEAQGAESFPQTR